MQWRITAGSSLPETTITGTPGRSRAQKQQAGEAAHAGHGQVEQHQIHVRRLFERGGEALEIRRLMDLGVGYRPGHRLAQRAKN